MNAHSVEPKSTCVGHCFAYVIPITKCFVTENLFSNTENTTKSLGNEVIRTYFMGWTRKKRKLRPICISPEMTANKRYKQKTPKPTVPSSPAMHRLVKKTNLPGVTYVEVSNEDVKTYLKPADAKMNGIDQEKVCDVHPKPCPTG